ADHQLCVDMKTLWRFYAVLRAPELELALAVTIYNRRIKIAIYQKFALRRQYLRNRDDALKLLCKRQIALQEFRSDDGQRGSVAYYVTGTKRFDLTMNFDRIRFKERNGTLRPRFVERLKARGCCITKARSLRRVSL